jgi:hypothetical protein
MARYMSAVMAFFLSRRLISTVTRMPPLSLTRMLGWLMGSEACGGHGEGGVVEAAQEFVPLPRILGNSQR